MRGGAGRAGAGGHLRGNSYISTPIMAQISRGSGRRRSGVAGGAKPEHPGAQITACFCN